MRARTCSPVAASSAVARSARPPKSSQRTSCRSPASSPPAPATAKLRLPCLPRQRRSSSISAASTANSACTRARNWRHALPETCPAPREAHPTGLVVVGGCGESVKVRLSVRRACVFRSLVPVTQCQWGSLSTQLHDTGPGRFRSRGRVPAFRRFFRGEVAAGAPPKILSRHPGPPAVATRRPGLVAHFFRPSPAAS